MPRVTSKDGTSIAYDRRGRGPAADAIAAGVPHAERQTIAGQTHQIDPKVLAPVLERFFR
jgi:hypothetical protein